jgi:hypothetical protein
MINTAADDAVLYYIRRDHIQYSHATRAQIAMGVVVAAVAAAAAGCWAGDELQSQKPMLSVVTSHAHMRHIFAFRVCM